MSSDWPRVPLGEVLVERRERIGMPDANGLPLLGVSNQDGLHRSGKERIADMSRYFRVERDWFAYNPMRINVGSIGLAESEEQTGVISPDYVVFSCGERLVPKLLYLFLRSRPGLDAINLETAGSVRERLYFESLSRIRFPLPPVAEQRRIAARVDAIAERVAEARRLRVEAIDDTGGVLISGLAEYIDEPDWPYVELADCLCEDTRNGIGTKPTDVPPGVQVLRISAGTSRQDWRVEEADHKFLPVPPESVSVYLLRPGDLLACRFNGNLHFVGRFALYQGDCRTDQIFPDKLIRFRPDLSKLLPAYARYALNTRAMRQQIEGMCATTAGNIGVSAGQLKTVKVATPPLPEQRRIVAHLDALQAKADALRAAQAAAAADLDALLPAVLAEAFAGRL